MNIARLKALIKKETLQITRDPSAILIAFVLPLLLLFLMGYAVSLDVKNIALGIISKSESHYANTLTQTFRGSKFFTVFEGKNEKMFKNMLQNNKLKALLIIDEEFGKDDKYKMQLLIDAVEPNIAGFVQKYSSSAVALWAKQEGVVDKYETKVESRYWFNAPISSRYFLIPGSIVVVMTMIGTLLTSLVIAREWERGTMEALMVTPSTMFEIIAGKIVPYFALGMFSLIICFVVAYFWYEIPFKGNLFILFSLGALYLFPSLSIGLIISMTAKNQFLAAQISLVASFLPAFLLSGFLFEIENMPLWLQRITAVIPARYFVESIQSLFLVGDVYEVFLKSAICIFVIGLLCFMVVLRKFKKGLK
jgi:ABC-2 type transport system permease protein